MGERDNLLSLLNSSELKKSRKVLLIEPNYKNKYPPMGLMKIATYFRRCKDDVRFFKGDLKLFGARLLCEEFFESLDKKRWGRYFSKFTDFIKVGKYSLLDDIPEFRGTELEDDLIVYRKRYKNGNIPQFECAFCAVTRLEPRYKEYIGIKNRLDILINTLEHKKIYC